MLKRFPSACLLTACLSVLSACSSAETKTPVKPIKTATPQSVAATSIASWSASAQGETAKGLRSLSGGDGLTAYAVRGGLRALSIPPGTTSPPNYLYFGVDRAVSASLVGGPLYVSIDYFDESLGGSLQLEYDSSVGKGIPASYRASESSAGGFGIGDKKWKTTIFVLSHPRFAGSENLGADFRLHGGVPFIKAVRLSKVRPANWAQVSRVATTSNNIKPLVKIGAGGQLIVGGFDTTMASMDAQAQVNTLAAAMPSLKSIGATSHEAYVVWALCEPQPGRFDWSVYDRYVALYKKNHIKWVPFLICGSAYSVPDWFYKKPGSQGFVCLEHGQESDIQSLWNPEMRRHVARFIQAFCEHYRDSGVIETILLGVSGNYGEAIFPASGGNTDWTSGAHGDYHSHPGFWAGDPFAVKDFQSWLRKKYATPERLNAAWGTAALTFDSVRPFERDKAPGDRARLDMADWYIGSMTEYSRFWLQETRKHFKGDIQLCTGGHAPPEFGSDFGDQCKVAAEIGGGVHITNEASDYATNFSYTHWVASAGRQYGAHFSFEPAAAVSPEGVVARIYNASAAGAVGLHFYYPNLFDTSQASANFVRQGAQFKQRHPVVEVAVFYPQTFIKLRGNLDSSHFLPRAVSLRRHFDYDYLSDGQIRDGGLKRSKVLVLMEGDVSEAETWNSIRDWVRSGGVLVYPTGMGRLHIVEGDEGVQKTLLDAGADTGRGRVITFAGQGTSDDYQNFLSRTLQNAPELSAGTRSMIAAGGQSDGVFGTLCEDELLWFNSSDKEVRRDGATPLVLPPHTIVSQRLTARAGGVK
jgi:hypothetical protein